MERREVVGVSAVDETVAFEKNLNTAEMGNNKKRVLDGRKLYEIQRKFCEKLCSPDFLVPKLP